MQQQQRPPSSHHTPRLHHTLRLHHTPRSHQARDDATSPTHTINGTRHQMSTVWSRAPRDGWRRGVAAARFPAKTPARTAPTNAHPTHLPVFRSEERQGEGWRVLSRLARAGVTRPEEGGARWLKDRVREKWCERTGVERLLGRQRRPVRVRGFFV